MRELLATMLRCGAVGAGIGGACGLILVAASLIGGRHVWAGMLLLAGVISWPAGLWVFDPLTRGLETGLPGADYAVLVSGPLLNGAVLGAILGCLVWVGPRAGSKGTA